MTVLETVWLNNTRLWEQQQYSDICTDFGISLLYVDIRRWINIINVKSSFWFLLLISTVLQKVAPSQPLTFSAVLVWSILIKSGFKKQPWDSGKLCLHSAKSYIMFIICDFLRVYHSETHCLLSVAQLSHVLQRYYFCEAKVISCVGQKHNVNKTQNKMVFILWLSKGKARVNLQLKYLL